MERDDALSRAASSLRQHTDEMSEAITRLHDATRKTEDAVAEANIAKLAKTSAEGMKLATT